MDKRQSGRESRRSSSLTPQHGFLLTSRDSLFPLAQQNWRKFPVTHHYLQLWDLTKGSKSIFPFLAQNFTDAWCLISVLQQAAASAISFSANLLCGTLDILSHPLQGGEAHSPFSPTLPLEHLHTATHLSRILCCNCLPAVYSPKSLWLEGYISKAWQRLEPTLQRSHFFLRQGKTHSVSSKILCDWINAAETEEEIRGPNPRQGKTSSCDG